MRCTLFALISSLILTGPLLAAPSPFFADAPLRAVQFIDRNEGWAVGDEGTIWHTIDSGTTWERQPSGTRASLRGLHFLTPYTGCVVGRIEMPTGGSVGVILQTTDGGLTWTQVSSGELPGLNVVKCFDERNAIVAGDGSDAFPTGVFRTSDSGKSWKPLAGVRSPSWLTGDFIDAENGTLGGAWSRLAPIRTGTFGSADVDSLGGRSIRSLKIQGQRAVAVGQGGMILISRDSAGIRWGFTTPPLAADALACCDFHGVTMLDSNIWVVGRPGSIVLHSTDAGKTWTTQKTPRTTPLHAVHFISHDEGWAVGDLGIILATKDGGKTWAVQHEGAQRTATLAIHARSEPVALETVAMLGQEQGYLTTTLTVTSPDPQMAAISQATHAERLDYAMRATGGGASDALWQFPWHGDLDTSVEGGVPARWKTLHAGKSTEHLLRQMVFALRMWKPEVVLADPIEATGSMEQLTREAVKEAFKQAADANAFPEQISELGLTIWGPKKLYAETTNAASAPVHLEFMRVQSQINDTPKHHAGKALPLISGRNPQAIQHYRLLAARGKGAVSHTDLMEAIDLAHGGTARRVMPTLDATRTEQVAELEKALKNWQVLETLGTGEDASPLLASPDQVIAHLGPILKKLPDDHGAYGAALLARQFVAAGQWQLAREVYFLLIDRYPGHPLAIEGYRWLARYHSSSEARRRHELGQFKTVQESVIRANPLIKLANDQKMPQTEIESRMTLIGDSDGARKWLVGTLEVEPRLAGFGPTISRDPAMQMCMQSARRQLGQIDGAKKWYESYLKATAIPGSEGVNAGDNVWRECAAAELWVLDRSRTKPTKPIANCRETEARPHLDGKLDDACWAGTPTMNLSDSTGTSAAKSHPTRVRMAYDTEFLYIGLECQRPALATLPTQPTKRGRDSDLLGQDRVSIMLDLDRDYGTYFRFEIDQRGLLADDCWGDKSWNPKWFVSVSQESTSWTAEIAIPLTELTGDKLNQGRVWACNAVRTIPGVGIQAWSKPADSVPRPEGMGLLQFISPVRAR